MYSTHIAAIKSTGNMFSYEAIEELNIKPKSFRDLLTDEPYQRKDLIIVQDPALTDKFNLNSFHHIKNKLKVDDDGKLTLMFFWLLSFKEKARFLGQKSTSLYFVDTVNDNSLKIVNDFRK